MYAERYAQPTRLNPGGLAAAIAINAAFVAALVFSAPHVLPPGPIKIIDTFDVPVDRPPPPDPDRPLKPKSDTSTERVNVPTPLVESDVQPTDLGTTTDFVPPLDPSIAIGPVPLAADPPSPPPPLPYVEASVDPRYAGDLQPDYPPSERRAGNDGRVTVRVLIGVDGRVRQAERVSATSDAFWRTTLDRALRKWRFRAATRGGVPVEAWRTMTLRFELTES